MKRKEIIKYILHSNAAERASLAKEFVEKEINLSRYMNILLEEHPISMRFSWFLNDVAFIDPHRSKNILSFCLQNYDRITVKDKDRVIAKQCYFSASNLPSKHEGEIVSKLFSWLENPLKSISTREYALKTLDKLCLKYPEFSEELYLVTKKIAQSPEDKLFRKTVSYLNKKFK